MLSKESYIRDLDLGYLEKRLENIKDWSEEDAKSAVRRYKNFLILICNHPHQILAPAPDIDEAWHNHILYTKEYMRDCQAIFGEYLHHAPAQNSNSDDKMRMEEARDLSSILYREDFGESYLLELDIATFW